MRTEHRETTNIAVKERNPNCCFSRLKVKIRSCLVVVCWSDLGAGPARETGAAASHDHGLLQSPRDTQARAQPGHQHSLGHTDNRDSLTDGEVGPGEDTCPEP